VTQPDLTKFFHPESIAIVGVPRKDYRFGGLSFMDKLLKAGYPGRLYPINPKAEEILGFKVYPNLSSLPEVPDLAMVSVTAQQTIGVLEECGRLGLRHIHILSSGYNEIGTPEGLELEARLKAVAKEYGLLVIGPNCMGPYCPASGLTAWGAIPGINGPLGVISQSGGLVQRLTEYTASLGLGTAKAVSIGNATVLNAMDYLEYMAEDEAVKVIGMYLEGIPDGRRLMTMVREVNRKKPIVFWKGGATEVGAATVSSHTGAMAGHGWLWDYFYRQTGVVHVRTMDEWVDALMALAWLPAPQGKGVFLMGGGGGNSVANGDFCIEEGLEVPALSEATMAGLRRSVPQVGSIIGNPLDMWLIFMNAAHMVEVLEMGYQDPAVDMIVVDTLIVRKSFHMPEQADPYPETIEYLRENGLKKPTVFTVDSEGGDPELAARGAALRAEFGRAHVPAYPTFQRAARALTHHYRYYAYLRSS